MDKKLKALISREKRQNEIEAKRNKKDNLT
jgi:hypothetical protein